MAEWVGTRIQSNVQQTPFAPTWDYTIGEKQLRIDVKSLEKLILEKEQEIIQQYPGDNDGNTGLGPDSLTSRFKYFNVLLWDHDVVRELHQEIKRFHKQFTTSLFGLTYRHPQIRIRCWANVLRKNQKIKKHFHSNHPHTYLGGHLSVKCVDTQTVYCNPYGSLDYDYYSDNTPGKLSLFPNYIPHYTTPNKSDEPRITIAFDLTTVDRRFVYDNDDTIIDL